MLLKDIIEKYQGGVPKVASAQPAPDMNSQYENGSQEGAAMVKMASALGNVFGAEAVDMFRNEMTGFFKSAAFQELVVDALLKVAENVGGTTASGHQAAAESASEQVAASAAEKATMAVAHANDAVQSAIQGDHHTAAVNLNAAGELLQRAGELAQQTSDAAVHAHIGEASQIVSQCTHAAQAAQAQHNGAAQA